MNVRHRNTHKHVTIFKYNVLTLSVKLTLGGDSKERADERKRDDELTEGQRAA